MLRFLILLIGFVYCDAGVASGLHAPTSYLTGGLATSPALLSATARFASAAPLYGGLGLGFGPYGYGAGGLGLASNGLGYGAGGLGLASNGLGYGYGAGGLGLASNGLGYGYGAGGLSLASNGLGLAQGPALFGLGGFGLANAPLAGPVPAAIQSHRSIEVTPVVLPQEPAVPQVIEVDGEEQPVQVIFRSASSRVLVQQVHTPGAPGQVEATRSEDEPHRVVHEVLRPVIQEVREVIQPYRRVTQEVRPVVEEIHTVVAKGEPRLHTAVAPVASGLAGGLAAPHYKLHSAKKAA